VPTNDIYSAYDQFAWFYNKFWGKWTEQVFPAFEKLFLPLVPTHGVILDLCCGTGRMAAALTSREYHVIGVDGSDEMLNFARINAPGAKFIRADARSFVIDVPCDAAFSTYDSLNHLETIADLKMAFESVRRALKPGGPFLFDLNNEAGFSENWKGSFGRVDDESAVIAAGSYDPQLKRACLDLAMFRLIEGSWQRSDLSIIERCFTDDEVALALEQSRFEQIRTFNSSRDLGYKSAGRTFWLAIAK
jgi:SAM-dependent methyltransferase